MHQALAQGVDKAKFKGRLAELRPLTVPLLGWGVARRQAAAVVAANLLPVVVGVRQFLGEGGEVVGLWLCEPGQIAKLPYLCGGGIAHKWIACCYDRLQR
jgi:hypothetical protein